MSNVSTPSPAGDFLLAIKQWREWMQGGYDAARRRMILALGMPPGAVNECNLYQDGEGRVWRDESRWNSTSEMYELYLVQLVRSGGLFSPYVPIGVEFQYDLGKESKSTNGRLSRVREVTLVRCSGDEPEEGWTVTDRSRSMSTLDYYRSSLRLHEEGLILADRLLSQWERIPFWMVECVRSRDRSDQSSPDGDWPELLRQFAPGFNDSAGSLPDNGGVLCALHEALDTLGGCQGIRTYYS